MKEEWKKITFQDGLSHYEVSNLGHVRLLPREVKTHIVNHGKSMYVIAHRQGKDVSVQYDRERPIVRLLDEYGVRHKCSLSLLMLKTFALESCPGNIQDYTAGYVDGNTHNNNLDNLMWVAKADLLRSIAQSQKGEPKEHFYKYKNIVIKVHDQVVGYFNNMPEGVALFNSYGFSTSGPVLNAAFKERQRIFYIFDLVSLSNEEYKDITSNYDQQNLKIIYDIIMSDRKLRGVDPLRSFVSHEKVKEEKKRLVDSSATKFKETKKQENKARKTTSKLDSVDDSQFYKEQEDKKQDFMKNLFAAMDKYK